MAARTLIVRADASVSMGTGHVMRCLALAQAWQDTGGRCCFAVSEIAPALADRLRAEGMEIECIQAKPGSEQGCAQLCDLASNRKAAWVVVDGYQFGSDYQKKLKQAGFQLLFVDDYGHAGQYYPDIVLNQNLLANEELYTQREDSTKLLLGSRYVLLRREFRRWENWQREISASARKVLVTMGGSDPKNFACGVVEALAASPVAPHLEVAVMVGSNNPHLKSLERAKEKFPGLLRLEQHPLDVTELMAWADVAISAAGSTCWELCMLGLPMIAIETVENQKGIAKALEAAACGVAVRTCQLTTLASELEALLASRERRSRFSGNARQLVDAHGAKRVVAQMGASIVRLRPVQRQDCDLLWKWVNDPEVRSASFSMRPVLWEEHTNWFRDKLQDPKCAILIATDEESTPLGRVRFERTAEGEAVISMSICKEKRGKGYARQLLKLSTQRAFLDPSLKLIHAYIKAENKRSLRVFEGMGYVHITAEKKGQVIHLVKNRNGERAES